MKKKLQQLIKDNNFSGIVAVKTSSDEIVLCNGYYDRANKLGINESTSFAIASGAKFFTALGIMRLVEEQQLSLEEKVFDIIKLPFKSYDPSVTVKHLLTHTSGLPDYYDEEEIEGELHLDIPWFKLMKPSDYIPVLPDKNMKFSPGEKFNYNNSGFILLSLIIELITGDYYKWIDNEIIKKANLRHTGYYQFDKLPKNTAHGYIELENGNYKTNIYNLPIRGGGDGGIYTCQNDVILLWNAFISGEIVRKETVETMLDEHVKGKRLSYGLGVWLEEKDGKLHPLVIGEDYGVSFETGYNLDSNDIYVLLSNNGARLWPIIKVIKENK